MVATSGALTAAAFLAACGGSGKSDSGTAAKDKSSLISPVIDETKQLKRGGVFKSVNGTPVSLDPHLTSGGVLHIWHSYNQLFRISEGYMGPANGDIEGEIVDSWELSPDKLTMTIKVTKEMGFAPLAPVNSRLVDAADVLFSWKRYNAISPRRSELANDADPNAPIVSLTSPDNQTIVIKLKEPLVYALALLGGDVDADHARSDCLGDG